ncbi:hypothetical protein BDM02DRAFT_3187697 [Thelephora ganbajun]|uniref:Uncharacterized protein n=1 Tax=Thelephora ganbajun TaxID=370292 RepID=A0ACB6ZDC9_THEGA|nr:hypothetical protein BDM02DRAFT_3187697 [Thelephora ganbajun]
MASSQENARSSNTVRRGSNQHTASSNLSGIGPARTIRPHARASVNPNLETKYGTVMKGFKVLETTCKDLKCKLADCEEKVRSHERAYSVLEERARSNETSHAELVAQLRDQLHSYDTAYTELVSQMEEKERSGAAAFTDLVSKMEEKIRLNETACMALVSQMEEQIQANEAAYSELTKKMEEYESVLKDRESDLTSLRNTIQESVTCGVCQGIPTQPCSTDCRHVFCAMCLLSWWQTKQENSCPTCRSIARSSPVRDPVQGFVALARAQAGEEEESNSFDADIFEAFFSPRRSKVDGRRDVIEIP